MKEKYGSAGRIEMIEERGFKFTGKSFWFIVRESGTEPVLRIGVESKDADITKAKMEELKRFIGQ
jgi:phosphomannomutase/phosphoglucomutase